MESGREHPIGERVRGYGCVGMEAFREPGEKRVRLRLVFRHAKSGAIRRVELMLPGDEEVRMISAFSFLFKPVSFLDHSQDQWEGRQIEIRFAGVEAGGVQFSDNDFPGPLYADSVREVRSAGRSRAPRANGRRRAGTGKAGRKPRNRK